MGAVAEKAIEVAKANDVHLSNPKVVEAAEKALEGGRAKAELAASKDRAKAELAASKVKKPTPEQEKKAEAAAAAGGGDQPKKKKFKNYGYVKKVDPEGGG